MLFRSVIDDAVDVRPSSDRSVDAEAQSSSSFGLVNESRVRRSLAPEVPVGRTAIEVPPRVEEGERSGRRGFGRPDARVDEADERRLLLRPLIGREGESLVQRENVLGGEELKFVLSDSVPLPGAREVELGAKVVNCRRLGVGDVAARISDEAE